MPAGLFAAIPKASVIAGFCPSSPSPFPPQSPPTSQCDSHHSHIAAQATIYTPMRQPPLTHNRLADAPKKQQPQKTVTLRATQPTKHPTLPTMCQPPLTHNHPNTPSTPQCASHHSHTADQPTPPRNNNRRKQPLPKSRSQPNTPHRPQCASHHSHITAQAAIQSGIHTATTTMRNQPLTHNQPANTPKSQQPQKTAAPTTHHQPGAPPSPQCASHHSHITTQTANKNTIRPTHAPMCQQPLTHSHPNRHPRRHPPHTARYATATTHT